MKSNILFKTKYQNNYIFNRNMQQVFLSHPIFSHILEIVDKNKNLDNWYDNLPNEVLIDTIYYSKKEIKYYIEKYHFFHSYGQFEKDTFSDDLEINFNKEDLEYCLSNYDQIILEVTERCNLKCKYCGYGEEHFDWYDKRHDLDLSYEKAINFLTYIFQYLDSPLNKSHKSEYQVSFYGGEPLLNMDLIKKVVDYVESFSFEKINIVFAMTTNAILLQKHAEYLAEKDFRLLVSLDGNEKHNCYRVFKNGKPAFDTIIKNINYVKDKYPVFFSNRVSFNSVLNNKSSVSEIYSFFKVEFNKQTAITEINADGIKAEKKKDFLKIYKNFNESLSQSEDYAQIEKENYLSLPKQVEVSNFIINQTNNSFHSYGELLNNNHICKMTGTCYPLAKKYLTAKGKILACQNVDHKYSFGNVTDNSVNLDLEGVANSYNDYCMKLQNMCFNCYNNKTCDQCFFFLNIKDEKPICEGFMNEKEFKSFISSRVNSIEEKPYMYPDTISKSQITK